MLQTLVHHFLPSKYSDIQSIVIYGSMYMTGPHLLEAFQIPLALFLKKFRDDVPWWRPFIPTVSFVFLLYFLKGYLNYVFQPFTEFLFDVGFTFKSSVNDLLFLNGMFSFISLRT